MIMDLNKIVVLDLRRTKWRWICLAWMILSGLVNKRVESGQTVYKHNQRASVTNESQDKGKRYVLYNYATDRPRVTLSALNQRSSRPRSNVGSLVAQKQHLAQLLKYQQYLKKLYAKRRSDIDSPILQGDISDYKDKEYETSPELVTDNQLKSYESVPDLNKKYDSRMVGLDYYTKDVLPADHVMIPHQDYHSPVESSLSALAGYSQYSQATDGGVSQEVLSKDDSVMERFVELEKLRELEELRDQAYRHLRLHPCQEHTCQHGHCISIGRGRYKCSCKPGYTGLRCQFAQHRACTPNPCMNDGVCTQVETGYECSCASGYRGKTCQEQLQCENEPCENGGTCTEMDNGFVCTCARGYRGKTCELENPCFVNPCQNGGKCVEVAGRYTCSCRTGWRCNDCSCKVEVEAKVRMIAPKPPVDKCQPNPCLNGGTCSPTPSGYMCYCDEGYKGDTCEAQNFCAEAPCMNGGLCSEGDGSFLCHCKPGFKGKSCEATDFCNPNPCLHNGVCVVQETGYKCRCLPQFIGQNCEAKNPCIPNPCVNMGACKRNGLQHVCVCADGFAGPQCQEQDQCFLHNPCKNAGKCHKVKGVISCQCQKGFTGLHCELKDLCESNPCANRGVCTSNGVSFHCRCSLGFTGQSCKENDYCDPDPCQNGARCFNSDGGYRCHCVQGYVGFHCENEDPCKSSPCSNSAQCIVIRNVAHCKCPKGYVGKFCEHSDPCLPNPCKNNGECQTHDDGSYHCECPDRYRGSLCQLHSHCFPNPCLNGGHCKDTKTGYICRCLLEWGGHNCEEHNLCYPDNPCENDGVCKSDGHNIICKCPPGFLGDHCEEVNFCNRHVCKNGGKCFNTKSGYECDCPEGFGGKNCDGLLQTTIQGSRISVSGPNFCGKTKRSYSSPCMPNPCINDGFCAEDKANEKGYMCICKQGFTGNRCHKRDECIPNPCKSAGKCFPADNRIGYHCVCVDGKRGLQCEHNDYCYPQNSCLNGATCYSTHVGYVCKCKPGFKGQKCEAPDETNPCALHPCLNHGTCYDQRSSQNNLIRLNNQDAYKCFCIRGYSGKNCEVPQYACYSEPCQHGGTCMDAHKFTDIAFDSSGYKCLCPYGFSGRNCQMNTRNIGGRTTDLISSLTSGYDRQGYVPVPKPDLESKNRKQIRLEETDNYGNVPVPTPEPGSFPTVRRSYDANPEEYSPSEQTSGSERESSPYTEGNNVNPGSPDYSAVEQPNEEQLTLGGGMGVPQSALSEGTRRGHIVRLPPGTRLVRLQRNDR